MEDSLPTRVKYLMTEAKQDCFFVVGTGNGPTERIGAIKTILMADSDAFRAMLQDSDLAEKGDIRVTDVEPDTFRTFLKCIYGGSSTIIPKLTFEDSAKLLYVTEKYLVNEFKTELTELMSIVFSEKDIFVALCQPICCKVKSVEEKMLEILKFDFNKITLDDNFLNLNNSAISFIMQTKVILVKETDIWTAVLRWAKHNTGSDKGDVLRLYILDFLRYFRFLTMDYKEFWETVVPTEILYEEEVLDICKSFGTDKLCSFEHLSSNKRNRYDTRKASLHFNTSFLETPKYAFIRCSVSSVSEIQSGLNHYTKSYQWAGHFWYLIVARELVREEEYFSAYLGCRRKMKKYSCSVCFEIELINQAGKPDGRITLTRKLTTAKPARGTNQFYNWNDLVNPENGFIKDNTIILLAKMKLLRKSCCSTVKLF